MNGGAVKDERSPLKDAMDLRNALQDPLFCAETPPPSFSLEDMSYRFVFVYTAKGETIAKICYRTCALMLNVVILSAIREEDGG
jgi:hypothetical protein